MAVDFSSCCGLTDLPDELLLRILHLLPFNDVVTRVSRVSKRFSRLTRDPR
jgi:hypothetical protein